MACVPDENYLIVAAIDFGTTYSGYAFSFLHEYEQDPLKISSNTWTAGTRGLMSQKTSTCILYDPKKNFHSFGFDAEDKYADLAMDEQHQDWYYFRRFKMELFNKMSLKRTFFLEDAMGKKMPALDVFSNCIKYLKDHLVSHCQDRLSGVKEEEIRWVLTVPAIWNDAAKQFMREAASKAGIHTSRMLIALEPEAASMFCRRLPMERFSSGMTQTFVGFQTGSKYLVLDAGGGTVDITVHETTRDGLLKEVYKASGGDWGGTAVDRSFLHLLESIVGNNVMNDLSTDYTSDYLDIFREFEVKKRTFTNKMTDRITFKVPIALSDLYKTHTNQSIKEKISSSPSLVGKVTWIGDKMRMNASEALGLYKEACNNIVCHLEDLFQKPELAGTSTILMVGGFSESPMLQECIKDRFSNMKVVIPQDAGLAVLKGAVMFGHAPDTITERKCKYTYGVEISPSFRAAKHRADKQFTDKDGKLRCNNIFHKHVEVGQTLFFCDEQVKQTYKPTTTDQHEIIFKIFASSEADPTYTTDHSCTYLGQLTIDLAGTGLDRKVTLQMTFGDTEIKVKAVEEKTGQKVEAYCNFLG